MTGPDFPTGGDDPRQATASATAYAVRPRANIQVRARYHVEERNKRKQIVFTEIPYQVKLNTILERDRRTLAKNGQIDSIADVNDESNERVGLRLVVELKRGVDR